MATEEQRQKVREQALGASRMGTPTDSRTKYSKANRTAPVATPESNAGRATAAATAPQEPKAPAVAAPAPSAKPAAKGDNVSARGRAFRAARAAGKTEFEFEGKKYHTRTAEEEAKMKVKKPAPAHKEAPPQSAVSKALMGAATAVNRGAHAPASALRSAAEALDKKPEAKKQGSKPVAKKTAEPARGEPPVAKALRRSAWATNAQGGGKAAAALESTAKQYDRKKPR